MPHHLVDVAGSVSENHITTEVPLGTADSMNRLQGGAWSSSGRRKRSGGHTSQYGSQAVEQYGVQPQGQYGVQPQGQYGAQPQGQYGVQPQGQYGSQAGGQCGYQTAVPYGSQAARQYGSQPAGQNGPQQADVLHNTPDQFAPQGGQSGKQNLDFAHFLKQLGYGKVQSQQGLMNSVLQTRKRFDNVSDVSAVETSKVKVIPVPVQVDLIHESENLSISEQVDRDGLQTFKRTMETYPTVVPSTCAHLREFLKKTHCPELQMPVYEHFVMKQVCLAGLGIFARIIKQKLSFKDVREHFENLASLLDLISTRSQSAASSLSSLLVNMITIMGDLTGRLEDLSHHHVTNWLSVAEFYYQTYNLYTIPRYPDPVLPVTYFGSPYLFGVGSFGTVHKVRIASSVEVAVKVVSRRNRNLSFSTSLVGSMIHHPLFVKIYSTFITNEAYLCVMELVKGIDVSRVAHLNGGLPMDVTVTLTAQLCLAVEYLHYMGFIHRDIMPSNMIMTPDCRMKLADFDTCKVCMGIYSPHPLKSYNRRNLQEFNDKEMVGQPSYMAPELIKHQTYGRAVDWWAVGVSVFSIRYGRIPFRGGSESEVRDKICSADIEWPTPEDTDPRLIDIKLLISNFLTPQIQERLCSGSYEEFRSQSLFEKVDWAAAEQNEVQMRCEEVTSLMQNVNGNLYPTCVEITDKDRQNKMLLFSMKGISNRRESPLLHTYASEGFKRVLQLIQYGQRCTNEVLQDPALFLGQFEDTPYKFKNYFKSEPFPFDTKSSM